MVPPIKRKKCCIPYCDNIEGISDKQFFRIGPIREFRKNWLPRNGTSTATKLQGYFCCQDHFDMERDAENYIRSKYIRGMKLKLRPNVLPQKKLPSNVCRLCLKLIYTGDDFVDISSETGAQNAAVVSSTLPEIDLSITVDPVVCLKCFHPLKRCYQVKQTALTSEVVVVNCIKQIVKRSPTRLINNCEIDLFEEYNDIKDMIKKETESNTEIFQSCVDKSTDLVGDENDIRNKSEEIVIEKEQNNSEYKIEVVEENVRHDLETLLEGTTSYRISGQSNINVSNLIFVEDGTLGNENKNISLNNVCFPDESIVEIHNSSNESMKNTEDLHFEVIEG